MSSRHGCESESWSRIVDKLSVIHLISFKALIFDNYHTFITLKYVFLPKNKHT